MGLADETERGEGKRGFAHDLLAWYDGHARDLAWRAPPGSPAPDPYRVWLAEVMLQQTTVATVTPRYARFLTLFPTIEDLAAAPLDQVLGEWAGLGYYARARNLHACAVVVAAEGWPRTEEGLRALPGLGAYTAASVAAIAFGERAAVVDGNVVRVLARVFAIERVLGQGDKELRALAEALTPAERPGDYAQAMMDLGATICRPRAPECLLCPVRAHCDGAARGLATELPVKATKKERPVRTGTVYVGIRADGAVLCERRAPSGLYGGMTGLPGSDWATRDGPPPEAPPVDAEWREVGTISHGLSHFVLTLTVFAARVPEEAPEPFIFVLEDRLGDLPTVFAKSVAAAKEGG